MFLCFCSTLKKTELETIDWYDSLWVNILMKDNRKIQSVGLYIVKMVSWPYIKIIAKNVHLFILRLSKMSMGNMHHLKNPCFNQFYFWTVHQLLDSMSWRRESAGFFVRAAYIKEVWVSTLTEAWTSLTNCPSTPPGLVFTILALDGDMHFLIRLFHFMVTALFT